MTDPSNSRHILPASVSSTSAAGPATQSRARVSIACESCKRRKCKCTGGPPCESCFHANIRCVFDESQDKRRKVHVKRAIDDLTITNETLAFQVKVFRSLQRAIQNDTHQEAFERIRQHASLRNIALALRDNVPEADDEESVSVDTDQSIFQPDRIDKFPGQSLHRSYATAPADENVEVWLPAEWSSSDVMELDPPAADALIGSDMRRTQHERNHYKGIVTQLQNGTCTEAEEAFRRLRASSHRNIFENSLSMRGDERSTYGSSKTLPEISTSIRTPRTSRFEREGSGFDIRPPHGGAGSLAAVPIWICDGLDGEGIEPVYNVSREVATRVRDFLCRQGGHAFQVEEVAAAMMLRNEAQAHYQGQSYQGQSYQGQQVVEQQCSVDQSYSMLGGAISGAGVWQTQTSWIPPHPHPHPLPLIAVPLQSSSSPYNRADMRRQLQRQTTS